MSSGSDDGGGDGGSGPKRPKGPTLPPAQHQVHEFIQRPKTRTLVRRWLLHLSIPHRDVEDLIQDVMRSAIKSAHTYDPAITRVDRWVNSIAVHVAAKYRERARHRREELSDEPPD